MTIWKKNKKRIGKFMEFLGQKLYHNQIIKEQYKNGKELYIYVLWHNNKQIASSKDVIELHKKIKNY